MNKRKRQLPQMNKRRRLQSLKPQSLFEKKSQIMGIVREYFRIKELQIPFMEGRPKRDTVINSDDINNFIILLNTEKDYDVFITLI